MVIIRSLHFDMSGFGSQLQQTATKIERYSLCSNLCSLHDRKMNNIVSKLQQLEVTFKVQRVDLCSSTHDPLVRGVRGICETTELPRKVAEDLF